MRFSIRSQILLSTALVMLAVVLGSFGVSVWLTRQSAADRIQRRIEEVSDILQQSAFPLTDRVLSQMSGLTGAEFALVDESGHVTRASQGAFLRAQLPPARGKATNGLGEVVSINGHLYFHRVLPLASRRNAVDLELHAFFDAIEYRRIWQRALVPSVVAAGSALVAAVACAYWIGGSVTRSTGNIISQLGNMAAGDFSPAELPSREDELREIAAKLNQTAEQLRRYEAEVRDGERMKTMVAMGAGLAHQLRNSATGCRMALDLFAEENKARDDEGLLVAQRQLYLIENYLQRFLLLAKVEPDRVEHATADLNGIVDQAVALVQHSAKHLNADLKWLTPSSRLPIVGDLVAVEQAVVNLLLNAIEAASAEAVAASALRVGKQALVRVATRHADGLAEVVVSDNGPGPNVGEDVFAPFVSSKKTGVGLGLAVVKEVAEQHSGKTGWRRSDDWTEFVMQLPLTAEAN